MSYSATIVYDDAASFSFNSSYVDFLAIPGTVRLRDLGAGTYSLTRPIISSQLRFMLSDFLSFSNSITTPTFTSIDYQIVVGTTPYWYSAALAKWTQASPDSLVGEFNSASVVNAHASTLFSDLNILIPQYIGFNFRLVTVSPSATPIATSTTLGGDWENGNPAPILECLLYANLTDLLGSSIVPDPLKPTKLLVQAPQGFLHGSRFVLPFTKEVTFDANGYAEISIIETVTPGIPLEFSFSYYDGRSVQTAHLFNALVPNTPTAGINSLTTVVPYSFG